MCAGNLGQGDVHEYVVTLGTGLCPCVQGPWGQGDVHVYVMTLGMCMSMCMEWPWGQGDVHVCAGLLEEDDTHECAQ